jgi:hypothetical protein
MGSFREYLEKEGVETAGVVELALPIQQNEAFLNRGLLVPRPPEGRDFAMEVGFMLEPDEAAVAHADVSTRVEAVASGVGGITSGAASAGLEQAVPAEVLCLLDWETVYLDLMAYKEEKAYSSLVLRRNDPRQIMEHDPRLYRLTADTGVFAPSSFTSVTRCGAAVTAVLKKYMDRLTRVRRRRWESDVLDLQLLARDDANFQDYAVTISKAERELIAAVGILLADAEHLYSQEAGDLPRIHFDRHLYQPLLVEQGERVRSSPPALNKTERLFVEDLRACFLERRGGQLADTELFLLRNLTKGHGIGFFEDEGFYPDFILWLKPAAGQRVIFVEPHGMIHEKRYEHDGKARLYERLPGLSHAMCGRRALSGVELDSYIVSSTSYEDLRLRYEDWSKEEYARKHILFQEPRTDAYDYIALLLTLVGDAVRTPPSHPR